MRNSQSFPQKNNYNLSENKGLNIIQSFQNKYAVNPETYSRLSIPTLEGLEFIDLNEVIYLHENQENCSTVHLNQSRKLILSISFLEIENRVKSPILFKVADKYMVNINKIKRYVKWRDSGFLVLSNGDHVPIKKQFLIPLIEKI